MDQVKVLEAYVRLVAMREHLPGRIHPRLAEEFHGIVVQLEEHGGVSLQAFRIPGEAIHAAKTLQHHSDWDGAPYTSVVEAYCDRQTFLMKLDGVLRLFQMLDTMRATGKSPIGFRPPDPEGESASS